MVESWGYAISMDGNVIVGCGLLVGGAETRAFRWTAATGMEELPIYAPTQFHCALDLSDDGSVAVGKSGYFASLWTGNQVISLGHLGGVPPK